MAARKKQNSFVRCFEVSDPTLHEKGHTIYKVTQKVNLIKLGSKLFRHHGSINLIIDAKVNLTNLFSQFYYF